MKIRQKTSLIVFSTFLALLLILSISFNIILMNGFKMVEREETERNVYRAIDAINESLSNLSIKAADWARWDDTYNFLEDTNSSYISSNLQDEAFSDLKINIMLFFNNKENLIFGREYQDLSERSNEITKEMLYEFKKHKLLFEHDSNNSFKQGIIQLPNKILFITSRPVTTSEGKGPSRGVLIFGKYFDQDEIDRLAAITHLSIKTVLISDNIEADMSTAENSISNTRPIFVNPIDISIIAGYTIFEDIDKKPLMIMRIDTPRYIYKQGRLTQMYLLISIILSGLIFGLILNFSLEKNVVSRLFRLNSDVKSISDSGDHSLRVISSGNDELTSLSSSINVMLQTLHSSEKKLLDQNRQMRLIMDTLPSGLMSLNENLDINPQYSQSVETIFGCKSLEGKSFIDQLFPEANQNDQREKLFEFLDILRRNLFPEKELVILNPFPFMSLPSGNWIKLCYHKIVRGADLENHILIDIEDITAEKQLEQTVKQSEQENFQLKIIAEDPDLFRFFLSDIKQVITQTSKNLALFITNPERKELLQVIFRDVHTIKGTACSFGLITISEIAGYLENCIHDLKESNSICEIRISSTTEALQQLSKEIQDIIISTRKILGDDFEDSNDINLKISVNRINHLYTTIEELLKNKTAPNCIVESLLTNIKDKFLELRAVPVKKGLSKALKIVPELQKRFKTDIKFSLEGGELLIDSELAYQLNTPLIHLLRNSFAHGIESFEERFISGKSSEGHILVRFEKLEHEIRMIISDDGRGIDPEYIKQSAIKKGFISQANADILDNKQSTNLIFIAGFSTAEKVNDISGRGVGMNAVYNTVVDKLNGNIEIESEIGVGTTFIVKISLNQDKIWAISAI